MFGLGDTGGTQVSIDPRYGSIKLSQLVSEDEVEEDGSSHEASFEVPLDSFTKDNFPAEYESFMDDSVLNYIAPYLLSSKEFSRLSL